MHAGAATLIGAREVGRIVGRELPFAGDEGAVAESAHDMAKGALSLRHDAKGLPVPVIVFTGHDLHAGGRAERLGIGMGKTHSRRRKLIETRCRVVGAAVASESFYADVIGHDQQDIAWLGGGILS